MQTKYILHAKSVKQDEYLLLRSSLALPSFCLPLKISTAGLFMYMMSRASSQKIQKTLDRASPHNGVKYYLKVGMFIFYPLFVSSTSSTDLISKGTLLCQRVL